MRFLAIFLLLAAPALAFEYEPPLADAKKEATAHEIFYEVRCLVCDGESLEGSNADFSVSMRALIREQLAGGASKQDVLDYLTERYGVQILQSPPKQGGALLLWLMPLLLIVVGLFLIRRRAK